MEAGKIIEQVQTNYTGVMLYLMIAIANINYSGLLDYALQAIVGGVVWFGFKVLGDWYDRRQAGKTTPSAKQKGDV